MKVDPPFVAALLRVTILGRMVKRAGINTESAEVAESTEEAQGRAAPPRRAGARTGQRFPARPEPSREKRKWAVEALGEPGKRAWRRALRGSVQANMPDDSMFISTG